MPRTFYYVAGTVFLVTSIVWVMGVANHLFLWREFWIYVGIFLVPALAVCGPVWLILRSTLWQRALGAIALLPGLALWGLSLLLVYHGFKIH